MYIADKSCDINKTEVMIRFGLTNKKREARWPLFGLLLYGVKSTELAD
ncbi:hypothetical protein VCHA53O463_160101 [Vibrio chagasii]|nr:hypothetical protein VCHA53O463_160101 [Vibrio chagasii]